MDVTMMYNEYMNGKSLNTLSKELHKDTRTIKKLFVNNDLKLKSSSESSRKYNIKEDYFDIIDSEDKAYFLGFLYADGYNDTNRGAVNLSLMEKDKEILEVLNNILQPTKPLQFVNATKSNKQNQYRLVIANQHISNQLVTLGCSKTKTFNIIFPTEEQVPSHLIHHFIRGVFDGDGCISIYKIGNYSKSNVSIISTISFLENLELFLIKELNFNKVKLIERFPERNTNIRALCYSGKNRCKDFGNWLYRDATIFLKRKKEKFDLL